MFGRLKEVDSKLFWIAMVFSGLWLIYGLLGIGEGYPLFLGIGIAVGILVEYYIAGLFYFIAVDKGYSAKVYLWIATLFGFVGYLLIVAMPDRGIPAAVPAADTATPNTIVAIPNTPLYDELPEL